MSIESPIKTHHLISFLFAGVPCIILSGLEVYDVLTRGCWMGMPHWADLIAKIALLIFPTLISLFISFVGIHIGATFFSRSKMWRKKIYLSIFFCIWIPVFSYLSFFVWGMGLGDHPPASFTAKNFMTALLQVVFIGMPVESIAALIIAVIGTLCFAIVGECFSLVVKKTFSQT